ncbi:chaperonin 10-like protein [Cercophora newfieldiana]|uniref:Chaperonin 10-like protein n=1 Tax=Cercophora newfieldiana TaxID=92897 RepID=A0AA40CPY6_9PEZI|nr:chaperonin 10-like protein [Cercophora newfieldiana]
MAGQTPPPTMKAQTLTAFNTPYTPATLPTPLPTAPYDLLIRVSAASYCHTDAVLAAGQMPPFPTSFPHIGCHEFAGTILSLPANSTSPYPVGTRLGVPGRSFHPCGTCSDCASGPTAGNPDADPPGYSVYCPSATNHGISGPGGFQEYAVVDWRQVAVIPEGMSDAEAATMMCAGLTIYAAIKRCGLERGERLGIMGAGGGLGHIGVQFAERVFGLRVVGVDVKDGPLGLAREVSGGEVRVVDGRVEGAEEVVASLGEEDGRVGGERGVDAVIILPESQRAFEYGMGLLRNHGKCVVVSFPKEGFKFQAGDVVFRDIQIVGSLVGSNKVLREMLEKAAEHGVKPRIKTYPLSGLNRLVEDYHKMEGGKLVVDMSLPDE